MSGTTDANASSVNEETAGVVLQDQRIDLPVVVGSENEHAIDISKLRSTTGAITLDPDVNETEIEIGNDVMLTGGCHTMIHPLGMTGFIRLTAMSTRRDTPESAARPFDVSRDGFVMGEGAGMLILERLDHALARGAEPLAELVGYGSSADAYRITDIQPEGRGAAGMLELESLSLVPSYEEDLEALIAFGEQDTPPVPARETVGWYSILENKLGEIPTSQR